jgi:hypothetical protein
VSEASGWDPTGDIGRALSVVTAERGIPALSDPTLLREQLSNFTAGRPVELSAITSAAEVQVAEVITSHVSQGLDIAMAVRLASNTLTALRPIDPSASVWVTVLFARAVGYRVDESAVTSSLDAPAASGPPPASAATLGYAAGAGFASDAGLPAGGAGPADAGDAAGEAGEETEEGWKYDEQTGQWYQWDEESGQWYPYDEESAEGEPEEEAGGAAAAPAPAQPAAAAPAWLSAVASERADNAQRAEAAHKAAEAQRVQRAAEAQREAEARRKAEQEADERQAASRAAPRGSKPASDGSDNDDQPKKKKAKGGGLRGLLGSRNPASRVGMVVVIGVIALVFAVGFSKLDPFNRVKSTTTVPSPSTTPSSDTTPIGNTGQATTTTTPGGTVPTANGNTSLANVMPDHADVSRCKTVTGYPTGLSGVTGALACTSIPGYTGWDLFGYQFDNSSDYLDSFQQYNGDKNYSSGFAIGGCPPQGQGQGYTTWQSSTYPGRSGQVLECLYVTGSSGTPQPDYIWSLPSKNAFFEMVGAPGATGAQVAAWWRAHGLPA